VFIFMAVIFWIGPLILVPLLVGIVIVVIYAWLTQRRLQELTESTYRAGAMRNATLIESLVGLDTIKGMGAEGVMQRRWEKTAAFLANTGVKLRLLSSASLNVTQWVQQLVNVSVIITGVYLIARGDLTMGGLIASTMLSGRVMAPLGQIAGLMTQYHNATTALASLEEIMAKPVERPADSNFLSRPKFKGEIEFRHVSFEYPGGGIPALHDVSFKINAGEHVAIMGRIGSGKSTLQKLAMGFYQPTDGAVLIDGVDLRQLDPAELRQQVGFVPQEATLFYGTLRENLVLGHQQADDEAVLRAAEFARLSEFVNKHPQGFDMLVGERGESLSGGQRKAVAMARAIIHNPPILLLDEPTGSMDHSTEVWVKQQLKEFSKGRTMMVVTHRTSLLEMADRIIVVDSGKIVADGPREQVIDALRSGRIGRAA
jgi:ATP-binding cassette subfamily C protein LapB